MPANKRPNSSESTPLVISETDTLLEALDFKPYRNSAIRRAEQFLPRPEDGQSIDILSPWGETLTAKAGDFIVSEDLNPEDTWPVDRSIFEESYRQIAPGLFQKRKLTSLIPLVEITEDPQTTVRIHTREGTVTVRAADYHLARGEQGEIWPIPNEKVGTFLTIVET